MSGPQHYKVVPITGVRAAIFQLTKVFLVGMSKTKDSSTIFVTNPRQRVDKWC